MNTAPLGREATLEDLWEFEGPAELINGEIVPLTGTQFGPGEAAFRIRLSLYLHAQAQGGGVAISESVTFVLQAPHIQAFVPDVSWFVGDVVNGEVVYGAPALAVEIRSAGDYGRAAERKIANKRDLYFAGGTLVFWDVDVLREGWIRAYHADDPGNPIIFHRGQIADAEPAVPGWRFAVDELFQ
ncbi:MAG TPA: Uma2 family endonuclease [Longimicrobiaceae bacterium]|nr:Uma2 family endonuclease [Longimicrobiaceae bacterium]